MGIAVDELPADVLSIMGIAADELTKHIIYIVNYSQSTFLLLLTEIIPQVKT